MIYCIQPYISISRRERRILNPTPITSTDFCLEQCRPFEVDSFACSLTAQICFPLEGYLGRACCLATEGGEEKKKNPLVMSICRREGSPRRSETVNNYILFWRPARWPKGTGGVACVGRGGRGRCSMSRCSPRCCGGSPILSRVFACVRASHFDVRQQSVGESRRLGNRCLHRHSARPRGVPPPPPSSSL